MNFLFSFELFISFPKCVTIAKAICHFTKQSYEILFAVLFFHSLVSHCRIQNVEFTQKFNDTKKKIPNRWMSMLWKHIWLSLRFEFNIFKSRARDKFSINVILCARKWNMFYKNRFQLQISLISCFFSREHWMILSMMIIMKSMDALLIIWIRTYNLLLSKFFRFSIFYLRNTNVIFCHIFFSFSSFSFWSFQTNEWTTECSFFSFICAHFAIIFGFCCCCCCCCCRYLFRLFDPFSIYFTDFTCLPPLFSYLFFPSDYNIFFYLIFAFILAILLFSFQFSL